jgi:O-Antigen ligase
LTVDAGNGGQLAAGRSSRPAARTGDTAARFGLWLGQAGLPFLLVAYLGLRGGGFDEIVRSEVGIAAWWVVLLGAAIGVLPIARLSRAAWIALGLLAAFAVWTGLAVGWSESAERSLEELGRVAALLAVFALALSVQGAAGLRRAVGAVGAAIVLVGGVALLSRLHPAWFPDLELAELLPGGQSRLHYPLDYWNGLAAFAAIGIPLLLTLATAARHVALRALATALVPALALTIFFTLSRGGAAEAAIGLAVLFAVHPRRLALLAPTLAAGAGSAILIAAASQRDALVDGLLTPQAADQGDEMLAMTIVVCLGVGLIAAALLIAERHGIGPRIRVSRSRVAVGAGALAVVAVIAALAAGAPGELSDRWEEFKDPSLTSEGANRFDAASGSGRYQMWDAALDAGASEPLLGIGPGTFEFWEARNGSLPGFVRDAHSLYFETFGELGIIGLLLIIGVVAAPFVIGIRRLRATPAADRVLLAGALGACAVFAAAAAIDWAWELTVLPVTFLLLAAAIVARPSRSDAAEEEGGTPPRLARFVLPALAVAGGIAILIPMAGSEAIRNSQANVTAQNLPGALGDANTAGDIEPLAASPSLQQALVLELQGDLDGAVAAAQQATEDEPTNWRTWLVLSRLEAKNGNAEGSVAAYREARDLNPESPLFDR